MAPMIVTFKIAGLLVENFVLKVKKTNFTLAALAAEVAVVTGYNEDEIEIVTFRRAKKVGRRYLVA